MRKASTYHSQIRESSQLFDSRPTPISVPRIVARMNAEHGHFQRVQHADEDGAGIGAGRRVGDHRVADLEARLAFEVVEAAGDLLAGEVLDGVGDEIPGQEAHGADHDDLEDPAADDRIVPGRHSSARGTEPSVSTAIRYSPCRPRFVRAPISIDIAVSLGGKWRTCNHVFSSSPPRNASATEGQIALRATSNCWGGTCQRIGGAYCRPPWVHSLLRPRSILRIEPEPTLRSKLSP